VISGRAVGDCVAKRLIFGEVFDVDVTGMQKSKMRGIDLAFERLQIIAFALNERDADLVFGPEELGGRAEPGRSLSQHLADDQQPPDAIADLQLGDLLSHQRIGAVGSFTALMMSLSRVPVAMAEDGYLPKVFAKRDARTQAPWVAILACAVMWALFFPLGFDRLVIIDVLLTGLSILLEFWALVALRIREPDLPRPYRVPGGLPVAIGIGIPPLVLVVLSAIRNTDESLGPFNALGVGLGFWFLAREGLSLSEVRGLRDDD